MDTVLKRLDKQRQKCKFIEFSLAQKKKRSRGKIPEIQQTLEILNSVQKKKGPLSQRRPDIPGREPTGKAFPPTACGGSGGEPLAQS